MRGYTQLTEEERCQIYALMKAGHSQSEIATLLGRHKSCGVPILGLEWSNPSGRASVRGPRGGGTPGNHGLGCG